MEKGPIGVFDSGYGGLTVLKELEKILPEYDYIYLGDNARAPYGTRSYQTVYHYTLECVQHLFKMGCPLIILACNTASAKALRTIQQHDLPIIDQARRVLGVIRPTTEIIGQFTHSGHVGILATNGTVASESYPLEIHKFFPGLQVFQQACPMWVPLVENNEYDLPGADYFVQKYIDELLNQSHLIDSIILACTHYPLLLKKIRHFLPENIKIISQGPIVAESLKNYLFRHPEMATRCSQYGKRWFYTTDPGTETFDRQARIFYGKNIQSSQLPL